MHSLFKFTSVFVVATALSCGLLLRDARAQTAVNPVFFEVVDTSGKPVGGATVETRGYQKIYRTGADGQIESSNTGRLEKALPVYRGDYDTTGFKISKQGYYSFEDMGVLGGPFAERFIAPIRIELLKISADNILPKEEAKRELMWAARDGDAERVRALLSAGIDANLSTGDLKGASVPKNVPAILYASASGSAAAVKVLLDAGADVSSKRPAARDALYYYLSSIFWGYGIPPTEAARAVKEADYDNGVDALIEAGANPLGLAPDGGTLLMVAARFDHAQAVKTLIEKGVNVNARDTIGATALMNSVEHPAILAALLKAGADPNVVTKRDPLSWYNFCKTALSFAIPIERLDSVKLLLANGAKPDLTCDGGEAPIVTAAKIGSSSAVKLLLEAGADPASEHARKALQIANERLIYKDHREYDEMIKLLGPAKGKN